MGKKYYKVLVGPAIKQPGQGNTVMKGGFFQADEKDKEVKYNLKHNRIEEMPAPKLKKPKAAAKLKKPKAAAAGK